MRTFILLCVAVMSWACGSDEDSHVNDGPSEAHLNDGHTRGAENASGEPIEQEIELAAALDEWGIRGAAFYQKKCITHSEESVTQLILTPYPINCEGSLGTIYDHSEDHVVAVIDLGDECGSPDLTLNTTTFTDNGDGTETVGIDTESFPIDITTMTDLDDNMVEVSFTLLEFSGENGGLGLANSVRAPHCGEANSLRWTLGPLVP